jgi:hypothetical protein
MEPVSIFEKLHEARHPMRRIPECPSMAHGHSKIIRSSGRNPIKVFTDPPDGRERKSHI